MQLSDIAALFGVTDSWICQIRYPGGRCALQLLNQAVGPESTLENIGFTLGGPANSKA